MKFWSSLSQGRSDFERDILESEAVQFVIFINVCSTLPGSAEDYLTPSRLLHSEKWEIRTNWKTEMIRSFRIQIETLPYENRI